MNKKKILFVLPAALLPYFALFSVCLILFSVRLPAFGVIMESIFRNNILYLLAALVLFGMLTAGLSVACFILSIRKGWDATSLAKSAMIIKLFQLPAYVLIFILGVLLAITLFTIPFSIALFLFDCLTLSLTGLLTSAAAINASRQGLCKTKEVVCIILLQLVFCVDVVASIVFYSVLKNRCKNETENI